MERILVVLPNWLGETLFATPFLRLLRDQHPQAKILTLGWSQCREILGFNPCVDGHIDYQEHSLWRSLLPSFRLMGHLRAEGFDHVFILRRSFSRTLLLVLAGIPERVGFASPKSGWLLTQKVVMEEKPLHKALTYLKLLGDSNSFAPSFEYVATEAEQRWARDWLGGQGLTKSETVVFLHPGANWDHKRWKSERFAMLGDQLVQRFHCKIAVSGGPEDLSLAEAVCAKMSSKTINLAGKTSLRQFAACLTQAQLFISNDTGVLHLAAALKRPLIGLYGPTSALLTGPLGDSERIRVLQHPGCCPHVPCYDPQQPHPGMDSIEVGEVFAAATELLQRMKG